MVGNGWVGGVSEMHQLSYVCTFHKHDTWKNKTNKRAATVTSRVPYAAKQMLTARRQMMLINSTASSPGGVPVNDSDPVE
jgi:hypothetical protein